MIRKHTLFVFLVCLGILGSCCGCFASGYYLSVEDLTLRSGETKALSISTNDEIVGITSADLSIATVTPDGMVTGKVNYATTITVRTKSGLIETCTVTVKAINCPRSTYFRKAPTGQCTFHENRVIPTYSYYELDMEQVYSGSSVKSLFFHLKGYDKSGQPVRLGFIMDSDWSPSYLDEYTIRVNDIRNRDTIRLRAKIYAEDTLSTLQFSTIALEFVDGTCGECTDYNPSFTF